MGSRCFARKRNKFKRKVGLGFDLQSRIFGAHPAVSQNEISLSNTIPNISMDYTLSALAQDLLKSMSGAWRPPVPIREVYMKKMGSSILAVVMGVASLAITYTAHAAQVTTQRNVQIVMPHTITKTGLISPLPLAAIVVSTTPANGAMGLFVDDIKITFNVPLNISSVRPVVEVGGNPWPTSQIGMDNYLDGGKTIRLTPLTHFPNDATVKVTVKAGAYGAGDLNYFVLKNDYSFSFTITSPICNCGAIPIVDLKNHIDDSNGMTLEQDCEMVSVDVSNPDAYNYGAAWICELPPAQECEPCGGTTAPGSDGISYRLPDSNMYCCIPHK